MTQYKLTYFDFAGSRGEECRLALHVAGVPFVDERIARETWMELKPSSPFGSLPILEIEGKGRLAQSNAILRFIGSTHGLHPSDAWEAAHHDALLAAVEDLRGQMNHALRTKDEAEKKRAREELANGYLRDWGKHVNAKIAGPFVAGEKINVADIKLFIIVRWFLSGKLDHIPATVFADYPKLIGVHDAVEKHPSVQSWYSTKH